MKLKSKVIKGSLILCVLGGLAIALILWPESSPDGGNSAGMGISFVKPAFAQEAQVQTFPAEDAGICAYVNVGKSIAPEKLVWSTVFKSVVDKGQGYILGVVELQGLDSKAFPYVYVNNDGWIAAFYPVNTPSSLIMDWANYDGGPVLGTNLHNAIEKVLSEFELGPQNFGFYHFGYPEATKLLLVVKKKNEFTYKIPFDVKIYGSSWSVRRYTTVKVDGVVLLNSVDESVSHGVFPKEHLTPEQQHTVFINFTSGYDRVSNPIFALSFIYGAK